MNLGPPYVGFAIHVLLVLALLAPLWAHLARRERQLLMGGIGLGVLRALVWPLERHRFDGHERHYFEVFRGTRDAGVYLDAGQSTYVSYPGLELAAELLGHVPGIGEGALLWTAVLAGGVLLGCTAAVAFRVGGRLAGAVATTALVALDPQCLLWSHDAFNVVYPAALFSLGLLAGTVAGDALVEERAQRRLAAAAGGCLTLAMGLRIDTTVWLPAGLLFIVWAAEPATRKRVAGWLSGAMLLGGATEYLLMGDLRSSGWYEAELWAVWRQSLGYLAPLDPWAEPACVLGLGGLLVLALRIDRVPAKGSGTPLLWLAAGTAGALGAGMLLLWTFTDVGARHTLPARILLALLAGTCLSRLALREKARSWAAMGAVGLLLASMLISALDMHRRYFVPTPTARGWIEERQDTRVDLADAEARGCVFVQFDSSREHFRRVVFPLDLLYPRGAAEIWQRSGGCVLWLRSHREERWDGMNARDSARKLEFIWRWEHLGGAEWQGGEPVEVWRWH